MFTISLSAVVGGRFKTPALFDNLNLLDDGDTITRS